MLRGFAVKRQEMESAELPWLLEAKRLKVHEEVGFATCFEYLEHVTGYTLRMLRGECQGSCRPEEFNLAQARARDSGARWRRESSCVYGATSAEGSARELRDTRGGAVQGSPSRGHRVVGWA